MKSKKAIVGIGICFLLMLAVSCGGAPAGVPLNVMVPPGAFDDTSITVIWSKSADYSNVDSYNVYQNNALAANTKNLFYTATGLTTGTSYSFSVTAKLKSGSETVKSNTVTQATVAMKVINIEDFKAVGDGVTLNTGAIQLAIDACVPGGKVLIPAGKVYVSGALFLKSNMTLQIDGALRGSDNVADYPKTNWRFPYYPSKENYTGLINAYPMKTHEPLLEADMSMANPNRNLLYGSLTNIRICGSGIINGGSDQIGSITGHGITKLGAAEAKAPGSEDNDRGDMIAIKGVNGLYIGGLTLYNPAMHVIFASYCKNVTIAGLNVQTYDIHNADGIDLCTTDTAYIFGSTWDTGDDCINTNAGQGQEGVTDGFPDQNIRVFDNLTKRGHGGVVFGSFTGDWIKNVLIEDCVFDGTEIGFRFKTGNNNGGGADNVTGRDCIVKNITVRSAIFLDSTYNANNYTSAGPGQFKNISFSNITCSNLAEYGIYVNGLEGKPHSNLSFKDITIDGGTKGGVFLNFADNLSFDKVTITKSTPVWSTNTKTTTNLKIVNSTQQ